MTIRQAKSDDFDTIHEFVKTAFQTAQMPYDNEEDFVLRLRARDTYIPELELVAEENGEIIGHIMFTKLTVNTDEGEYIGLLLAPLAVKLEERSKGIGEKLTYAGFEIGRKLGYTASFLVGYPDYYKKFGYKEIGEFGIENKTGIENEYVLGCEIVKGSLDNIMGYIDYME